MPRTRPVTAALVAAALIGALAACDDGQVASVNGVAEPGKSEVPTSETKVPAPPVLNKAPLTVEKARSSGGTVAAGGQDAPYNYAPTLLQENGRVRAWWCSQIGVANPAGDDILLAEAPSAVEPFTPGYPVLAGSFTGFDGMHTCDPSVIKVGQTYYMYYTGAAGDHAHGNGIGVATSPDGAVWARANGGKAILGAAHDAKRNNTYGSGQPAALHLDGWFYLMFTDTTGQATADDGAGQFVLRSKDPLFGSGVEALGEDGFKPVPTTNSPRTRSIVQAFSADWMWIEALGAFAIAHETDKGTTITFWDREFQRNPYEKVLIAGPWQEGPGLVRTGQGHAPIDPAQPCTRVQIDVLRATVIGAAAAPTNISHFGIDIAGAKGCATKREASVLDGFAVPSPERTIDLIAGGKVVRIERRSVAAKLAKAVLADRPAIVDQMPVAVRVPSGAKAVVSPQGKAGFVLDDKLWVVPAEIMQLNDSAVEHISEQDWNRYERRSELSR